MIKNMNKIILESIVNCELIINFNNLFCTTVEIGVLIISLKKIFSTGKISGPETLGK